MCRAFPASEYYGGSAPSRTDRRSMRPAPTTALDAAAAERDQDGSRVHCDSLDEGGARLCPCGIATSTPQTSPWPPGQLRNTDRGVPHRPTDGRCAPLPAQIHQVRAGVSVERRKRRFLAYSSPSRSPDPHHLAVLARPGFVRAAPALPGITRIRLPSASTSLLRQGSGEGLSPPLEPTAPHGANKICARTPLSFTRPAG